MVRRTGMFETAQPALAPYGILSPAVTVIEEENDDWVSGFMHETSDASIDVNIASISGASPAVSQKVVESDPEAPVVRFYYPFDIQESVEVSTFGLSEDEIHARVETTLDIVTQKAIEYEFWNGFIAKKITAPASNRYLSKSDAINVTPTGSTGGVKIRYAQALLEAALGEDTIGSVGVLHAPKLAASLMTASDKDGALKTSLGNSVVAGSGYSNTGPDGTVAPAGKVWIYATGPVTVRVGQNSTRGTNLTQMTDIKNNTVKLYVDRPAAVTWSTSHLFAVLVDLTLDFA